MPLFKNRGYYAVQPTNPFLAALILFFAVYFCLLFSAINNTINAAKPVKEVFKIETLKSKKFISSILVFILSAIILIAVGTKAYEYLDASGYGRNAETVCSYENIDRAEIYANTDIVSSGGYPSKKYIIEVSFYDGKNKYCFTCEQFYGYEKMYESLKHIPREKLTIDSTLKQELLDYEERTTFSNEKLSQKKLYIEKIFALNEVSS